MVKLDPVDWSMLDWRLEKALELVELVLTELGLSAAACSDQDPGAWPDSGMSPGCWLLGCSTRGS